MRPMSEPKKIGIVENAHESIAKTNTALSIETAFV